MVKNCDLGPENAALTDRPRGRQITFHFFFPCSKLVLQIITNGFVDFYVGVYVGVYAQHIVGSKSKYFVCLPKFQNHVIERNLSGIIAH